MKPVDPRLARYARATRWFLLATVALGAAGAGLLIAQAVLMAEIVVGAFEDGMSATGLRTPLLLLAAVAVGRAVVSWLTELAAHRSSAEVKSELRMRLLTEAVRIDGSRAPAGQDAGDEARTGEPGTDPRTDDLPADDLRTGELAALATRGIDALDAYFARYLPQLGLAVVVPAAVLARIVTDDWVSAAIIAGTLPLIPVFMMLIGWATQAATDRQWRTLSRLSAHFLDVVSGLPTLKVFGRAKAQADNIRTITADYRRATMRTLRIAFLSSFALELLATISVALVAVTIGMRLVHGELDLYTGLVVLILAPEAYLPLRQVGTHYHAAAEGLAAADRVFAVLERGGAEKTTAAPAPTQSTPHARPRVGPPADSACPDARDAALALDGLVVRHDGRSEDSLPRTSLTLRPGETVALTGPSGAGKSTLLAALLGLVRPAAGRVLVGGRDLAALDLASWHAQVAWVPQRPALFAGTVADNVRLPRPDATDAEVAQALRDAAAGDLDPAAVLGEAGAGLSAGQRQRVALARAFLADRQVVLLDEPTATLDGDTEATVTAAIGRLARGRTVLLVAHRPALLAVADRVVRLGEGRTPAAASTHAVRAAAPAQAGVSAPVLAVPTTAVSATAVSAAAVSAAAVSAAAVPTTAVSAAVPAAVSVRGEGADGAATRRGGSDEPGPPRRGGSALRSRTARGRLALAALLGALALASAVGLMGVSGWLISRASEQPPVLYLMVAVTATRAFGIGRAVFRYTERLVSHDAVLRILADLRVAVYTRLERLAPAGLAPHRRGDLLTRLVADTDTLQDRYLRWLLPVSAAALVGAASVGTAAVLLPEAGAVLAVGLLAAGVGVPLLAVATARRTEARLAPARAALATEVVDVLTGTAELAVAGALPRRLAALRDADRRLTRIAARSAAALALGAGLSALICGLTVVGAAAAGAQAVHEGRLGGVWLGVVVLGTLAAFEAVNGMPLALQQRARVRRSAERVDEILDAPPPAAEGTGRPPADPYPVALTGVSARHPGQDGLALDGVDLTLTRGRRVAVVGASGSGKTTLAHVLLRFLDPVAGTYRLGGDAVESTALASEHRSPEHRSPTRALLSNESTADALACDPDAVRRLVGLCAQDAHLFDSTLRENLRLALPHGLNGMGGTPTDATDDDLRAALAAARLLDWVETLPSGLDTPVGEHGARLSGGQRQRLALARALLADFPVLVLDEPAEHLDLPTADALTADLLAATEGRTTVLITHRLTGLAAVDEIVVLDRGRVVQRGSYAELAEADGPFRRTLARERAHPSPCPHEDADSPRTSNVSDNPDFPHREPLITLGT
ncbi:thiol reductant ABC exporter subunit CydD [Streptomyces aculeolatus]|uniref:thiol reductant ABC exporter subunit CydD n=1 Tax=Streptomyces aculeolatus TaxID=270689 RepID=UPI001CED848E|nr:thiol reductant ABC exporter subunit CydD [Streptomyces aculeolatus]